MNLDLNNNYNNNDDENIKEILLKSFMQEADFWRNYFYRVGVLQQSYELDMATLKKVAEQ